MQLRAMQVGGNAAAVSEMVAVVIHDSTFVV